MVVEPYLIFDGRCDEAIAFYKKAIGAEVQMLMRFKDNPQPPPAGTIPPEADNKVMHASLRIGDTTVMASDGGHCTGHPKFGGFSLSISAKDEAQARKLFAALGDGGTVTMPMSKTFFSPAFGMVTDRLGVSWMVIVPQQI